ncbi:PGF-CTERM sorting domain-containing protein [Haloprofundus sp. MHR1]|nr:PGF-CTERM sorting domain-containing protein [Haloprofundus sp. MHR1]
MSRSPVPSGEPVTFVATLENPTPQPANHTVRLRLFGEIADVKTVTVPAGETVTVQFTRTILATGEHTARVGDQTATVSVTESQVATDEPETTSSTGVPGFGVGVALAALLAVAALALRRE